MTDNDAQVLVRLPSSAVEELDALADELSKVRVLGLPNVRIRRAGVVRMIVLEELARRKSKAKR
jgi:hypothetical protein